MRTHDTLNGGTRARLDKMRRYRDDWNRKADSGERRYAMRSRLADGLAGALQARSHGVGKWDSDAHGIGDNLQRDRTEMRGYVSAPWELVDGWRDVGDSGDIVRLRHTGWYSDAHESETYRGHVWQLPARDGTPRYVAGYVEDQGGRDGTRAGGYVILETDRRGSLYLYDEKEDAARAGDELAQRMAEEAREYDTAWQAGARHAYNMQRIAEARKEAREVARAARDNVKNNPTICDVLRGKVRELRAEIRELCEENEMLRNGDFSKRDYYLGFYTGSPELRAAFNEGAGGDVLQ